MYITVLSLHFPLFCFLLSLSTDDELQLIVRKCRFCYFYFSPFLKFSYRTLRVCFYVSSSGSIFLINGCRTKLPPRGSKSLWNMTNLKYLSMILINRNHVLSSGNIYYRPVSNLSSPPFLVPKNYNIWNIQNNISMFHRTFFNSIIDKTPTHALFTQHYISLACWFH